MIAAYSPVLVTGAAGFVGAGIVHALIGQGHEVHVLLRSGSDPWRLRPVWSRLTAHTADLMDADAVAAAVARVQPRAVLHLAAHGAYERQSDARAIIQTNILGTYNLLDAASRCTDLRIVVNTGSSSEYGFKTEAMREADRVEPNRFYAVAKAAQTHLVTLLAKRGTVPAVTFRLFSVYGPWEEPTRLIPTLVRRVRAGLPLEMVGPAVARDFVYLDDVTDLLTDFPKLAAASGGVFNLGTGRETTLAEVVEVIQELAGRKVEVRWGAMPARQWDATTWRADPAHAAERLGWVARVPLREGLARTIAWSEHREREDEAGDRRKAA